MDEDRKTLWRSQPNSLYSDFVSKYLLNEETNTDPFQINIGDNDLKSTYVIRKSVEKEIQYLGTGFIVGEEGIGKSTLFRRITTLLPENHKSLIVRLSLAKIASSLNEKDLLEGKLSILTPYVISEFIFNEFWNHLLLEETKRKNYLPDLRRNKIWMQELRRFYQKLHPSYTSVENDFELMAWLETSFDTTQENLPVKKEDLLRDLIDFITYPIKIDKYRGTRDTTSTQPYTTEKERPYKQVLIILDDTELLSNKAINRLLQDIQRVYNLGLSNLSMIFFFNTVHCDAIATLRSVKRGEMPIIRIPEWNESHLRLLLKLRLEHFGNQILSLDDDDVAWGKKLPSQSVINPAKSQFVDIIIDTITKPEHKQSQYLTPLHALRLTRGLLAACAGSLDETLPLDEITLREIARSYWLSI